MLTQDDAGRYIGASKRTVQRLIALGALEAKTMNRLVLVTVASLDAFLDGLPDARQPRGAPPPPPPTLRKGKRQ